MNPETMQSRVEEAYQRLERHLDVHYYPGARDDLRDLRLAATPQPAQQGVETDDPAANAVDAIMRGFSFSTLVGPENLRARLSLCARQAIFLYQQSLPSAALNQTGESALRSALVAIRDWQLLDENRNPNVPADYKGSPYDYLKKMANDALKESAALATPSPVVEGRVIHWRGTEEDQHNVRMKACRSRRHQWGEDDCEDKDGSCAECDDDMAEALRVPAPTAENGADREAVARIIDPEEWAFDDFAKTKGERSIFLGKSLAKADAILSALHLDTGAK